MGVGGGGWGVGVGVGVGGGGRCWRAAEIVLAESCHLGQASFEYGFEERKRGETSDIGWLIRGVPDKRRKKQNDRAIAVGHFGLAVRRF